MAADVKVQHRNFERVRGDRRAFEFWLRDRDGAYAVGGAITLSVAAVRDPTAAQVLFAVTGSDEGTVTDDDGLAWRKVQCVPAAADVERTGRYYYDLEIKDGSGLPDTVCKGWIEFEPDISRN